MAEQNKEQLEKQAQMDQQSLEIARRAKEPQPPFKIAKIQLVEIAGACQERDFSEEVDLIQDYGGNDWFETGLNTNFKTGISGDQTDIEQRNFAFQNNEKPVINPKGFFALLCEALSDSTLITLSIAAVVSIIISMSTAKPDDLSHAWIDGFAIIMAVVVCSLVTAINDYQKERQFQKLNNVADERKVVSIMRGGQIVNLHQSKVLVGDIVLLSEGMEIPADGFVLEAAELTTDESAMTGETDPIRKEIISKCIAKRDELIAEGSKNTSGRHDVPSCIILSGTRILTGEGKLLITVVGDSSCVGKISALLRQDDPEATPLQLKLTKIADDIGRVGFISAIAIIIVMLIRFTIERSLENQWDNGEHLNELLSFFIIGITVVVVAIPEGLPLAVTLSLAFSVKKMLKDQNLVRKLQACETMGGANNICSDKTGTLTLNKMTLTTIWNDSYIQLDYNAKNMSLKDYFPEQFHEIFLMSCAVNSSAALRPDEKGSKTEVAILLALDKFGFPYEQIREKYSEIVQKLPFSSARKRMSIIIKDSNGKQVMLSKGASEMVLKACNKFHNMNTGQVVNLDEKLRATVEDNIKRMADDALRTICVAYRDLTGSEDISTKDHLGVFDVEQHDLTLVAVFGIADVIRVEVPLALEQCKRAGITVRMVTGDNIDTARAIARLCGLIDVNDKDALVIEGPKFIELTGGVVCKKCQVFDCDCPRDSKTAQQLGKPIRVDTIKNGEVFDSMVDNLRVMARSRPEDKYALVTGLIERDNVVAVTGDGTNDAPALKKADVGFAMGIAGTEVARQAAAIILLDDNFKSIVKAVMWGRNIYDSIKKFLQFQLTVNIVAVVGTLIGAAVIKQEIFTPIQMLWVNLIMDTFASLALATEPPHESLLLRKPHNRFEYIVTQNMCKHILVFDGENWLPEVKDYCPDDKKGGKDAKCFDNWIISKFYEDNVESTDTQTYWEEYLKPTKQINEFNMKQPVGTSDDNYLGDFYPYMVRYSDDSRKYVTSGRLRQYDGLGKKYRLVEEYFLNSPSRHFTYVFNIFVMLQVFNFFNSRKLKDDFNIFQGITRNFLFPMMMLIVVVAEIILITFGSISFSCYRFGGLTVPQWFICIGFGAISNIWSIFLKLIPDSVIMFNLGWGDKAVKGEDDDEHNELLQENEQGKVNHNTKEQAKKEHQLEKANEQVQVQKQPDRQKSNEEPLQQSHEQKKEMNEVDNVPLQQEE